MFVRRTLELAKNSLISVGPGNTRHSAVNDDIIIFLS